jgi:hypothetical protein
VGYQHIPPPGCLLLLYVKAWERQPQLPDTLSATLSQAGHSRFILEFKLEETVGYLGSTLPREHKHLIPTHGHGEVAARWRDLATLGHLQWGRSSAQAPTELRTWAHASMHFEVGSLFLKLLL